jgi:hypothetical protein
VRRPPGKCRPRPASEIPDEEVKFQMGRMRRETIK